MSEFLWEIGTEEIPAAMAPNAIKALKEKLEKGLKEAQLGFDAVETQGTPRRLMACVTGLVRKQEDVNEERRGPPVDRAFDAEGNPSKAAQGFAKSCGVAVEDLGRIETKKGEYLGFVIKKEGRAATEILPEIMGDILTTFPWPKSMRWGGGKMRFVRPVNWMLSLLDGQVLPFETVDGLKAGDETTGHRFMARGPHKVKDRADYEAVLKNAKVILSWEARRNAIKEGIDKIAAEAGGTVIEFPDLLAENAGLNEWPTPILGRFDESYLEVPPEVLVTSMKKHQKYFSVVDGDSKLLPYFIAISNIETPDANVVVAGNERVLNARLSDAAFFWNEDRKGKLEDRLENLKGVVFQAKLGTVYEKAMRMEKLAARISAEVDPGLSRTASRAARLSKCDLVTGMVGEFAQLQGIMGCYYAKHSGETDEVAEAIEQHYQPQGAGDALPVSEAAAMVSLADKFDTLTGCFAIGLAPTGSKDPFALRRAALGIIRMILSAGQPLSLKEILSYAHRQYADGVLEKSEAEMLETVLAFFYGRLKNHLKADGYDHDLIDAVQALDLDDLVDVVARVKGLAAFKALPQYEALVAANKRIANIIEKAKGEGEGVDVDASLLSEEAEKLLHDKITGARETTALAVKAKDYPGALGVLAETREAIDAFFDHVMVMDKDDKVRINRLALLRSVRAAFHQVADVSRLALPETS